MQLNESELQGLRRLLEVERLTHASLTQRLGVGQPSVSKWLSGGGISQDTYEKLLPMLVPYLPTVRFSISDKSPPGTVVGNMADALKARGSSLFKSKVPPATGTTFLGRAGELQELVVLERRGIEEVSAGLGSLCQGWDCACVVADYPKVRMGLVKVSGESMLPLANGTELVVEPIEGCELLMDGASNIGSLRLRVPDGSLIVFRLNDDSIALKRIFYMRGTYVPLLVELHADNGAWSEENGWPYRVKKSDHLVIQGKVIGKVKN